MKSDQQAYLDMVREKISEFGVFIQYVGGSDSPAWAYTVGLHAQGLPELIMVGGLDRPAFGRVLNGAAARLRTEWTWTHGTVVSGLLSPVLDLTCLEVDDVHTDYFSVALELDSGFRALQLVWPDMSNRMPWEDGYEFGHDEQPLLGSAPI